LICKGCGNDQAYAVKTYIENGEIIEICNRCGDVSSAYLPDVYVPEGGMHFEGLSHPDYPESYGGTFCATKAEKAYYLKKYGLQEAGDRQHGSNGYDRIAARHARESLRNNRRNQP
jgi:hypothetical protein